MPFSDESEMKDVTVNRLSKDYISDGSLLAYASEFPISYRVADIGFAKFTSHDFKGTQAKKISNLNFRQLWILTMWLMEKPFETMVEDKKLKVDLLDTAIIQINSEGRIYGSGWLYDHLGPIITVELKLERWKDALEQAYFYSKIADYSYVVLSSNSLPKVDVDSFLELGVGLLGADTDGLRLIQSANKSRNQISELALFYRLKIIKDLSSSKPSKWEIIFN